MLSYYIICRKNSNSLEKCWKVPLYVPWAKVKVFFRAAGAESLLTAEQSHSVAAALRVGHKRSRDGLLIPPEKKLHKKH